MVSPIYCLFFFYIFLHSIIFVRLVELQVICCFICLVSPVLLKVYEVLALSMPRDIHDSSMSGVAAASARGELWCRVIVL